MPQQQLNFIKGDKAGSETDWRDALPINMTAIARAMFGAAGYMLQYPGLTLHTTGEGVDRGGIWVSRETFAGHFRVSGESLIEINADGEVTVLGSIPGSDTAEFAYSNNNLCIVANGNAYLYNRTDGFRQITDSDLGNPIDVCWIDQYLFFCDSNSLFHTTLATEDPDGNPIPPDTGIDPLDFSSSDFSPDPVMGVEKTADNRVMVFNRYSCEFFQNNASDNFSFARLNGYTLEIGIVGTHAKAKMNDAFYCVGNRKEEAVSAYILSAGTPQKIATREIEKVIGEYSETALRDVVVEVREEDGYQHVIFHFPDHVLLFNQTIAAQFGIDGAWSILATGTRGNSVYRGIYGVFDNYIGKWVYGDKQSSNIGILDNTVATQYGDIARWELSTPYYPLEATTIDYVDIQTVPGFTMTEDATVLIQTTTDGFRFDKGRWVSYGRRGQYGRRLIARRFGYISEYVSFRLRGTSKSRMAIGSGVFNHG